MQGPIGVALSGGGFRAAAFHLGLLSYLNRVDLLKNVTILSTVSGGTFTGASYVQSLIERRPFSQFFRTFFHTLENTDLVKLALGKLAHRRERGEDRTRNLITAVADVYADTFFANHVTEKPYTFGDVIDADLPIRDIIFNTTEFRHGIAFRFQTSANPKARIGNRRIYVPVADARHARIADIAAASACFPGGFEPILFPDDFKWDNHVARDSINRHFATTGTPSIALMDGGIYDNQGIDSLLLADKRNGRSLQWLIISDVNHDGRSFYSIPAPPRRRRLTLGGIRRAGQLLFGACFLVLAAAATLLVWQACDSKPAVPEQIGFYTVTLVFAACTGMSLLWIHHFIRDRVLPAIPQAGRSAWDDVRHLTVDQVAGMVQVRMASLVSLTNNIFTKRIRSYGYRLIYSDVGYRGKRIVNLIYDLAPGHAFANLPGISKPSKAMLNIVRVASEMPTTLWFEPTRTYVLPALVACGQATTCYNLMRHIKRHFGPVPATYPDTISRLWALLEADWERMVYDPLCFVKEEAARVDLTTPPNNGAAEPCTNTITGIESAQV